ARAYVHLTHRITAPRVVLIGVFHRARLWDLENTLVFDSFDNWHGPWAPVPVDPVRQEILAAMPKGMALVSNTMHCNEHSLEALIPFLQHENPKLSIVPILVPYVGWTRIEELAEHLSTALASIMQERGWQLGRDLAVVVSSDSVHYGPDFDHAPFGVGVSGYADAVARENELASRTFQGPIEATHLENLLYTLVSREDVRQYRLPWCGRFSIPFGTEMLRRLVGKLGNRRLDGAILRQATSLSEPELEVSTATREAGLGYTAPSNLHHWVGYTSIGFRAVSVEN
ncbi:MAG: AmmeMemoRadiSam system protein B, partial [bacterium]|nr:AmmeMemoRadiSam system protein B [bacterium]